MTGAKGQTGRTGAAGRDGADGTDGADGVSPRVFVHETSSGYDMTVIDKTHDATNPLLFSLVNGKTGMTGPQGIPGVAAERGATGVTGPQGGTGQTGPRGLPGERGAQGLAGLTGPQGVHGQTGATGPAGAKGATGKSAYELAVENGFEGTEQEWLAGMSVILNMYKDAVDGGLAQDYMNVGAWWADVMLNYGPVCLTGAWTLSGTVPDGEELSECHVVRNNSMWALTYGYDYLSPNISTVAHIDDTDASDVNIDSLHFTGSGFDVTATRTDTRLYLWFTASGVMVPLADADALPPIASLDAGSDNPVKSSALYAAFLDIRRRLTVLAPRTYFPADELLPNDNYNDVYGFKIPAGLLSSNDAVLSQVILQLRSNISDISGYAGYRKLLVRVYKSNGNFVGSAYSDVQQITVPNVFVQFRFPDPVSVPAGCYALVEFRATNSAGSTDTARTAIPMRIHAESGSTLPTLALRALESASGTTLSDYHSPYAYLTYGEFSS